MFQFTLSAHVCRITGLFAVVSLLGAALSSAQPTAASAPRAESGAPAQQSSSYSLPLPRSALPRSEYDDPHWRKPAIDLEVPVGTRVFVVSGGTVNQFYQADGCGKGVTISGTDGAEYTYCHLSSYNANVPDGVSTGPGVVLGYSGNTGRSSGPHLHFQIKVNGVLRCPQNMLLAIYDGTAVPAPSTLPTSGCTSG